MWMLRGLEVSCFRLISFPLAFFFVSSSCPFSLLVQVKTQLESLERSGVAAIWEDLVQILADLVTPVCVLRTSVSWLLGDLTSRGSRVESHRLLECVTSNELALFV